ncbi:phospholipid carrier-dependent glycosyltransferase [Streptomyces sp. PLAI1-29]|uniref:Phospholipid carrier-dependent glycosyltransferase n=2 Tax=Streptomyces zingiberis TaxID=2053010 RepID=A0ABX1BQ71_9ACTN|nr:phospholipid carrier-dependent glycosyltransferase [Streptomyces zingiberis]NJP99878.1 phospholipid carrier-dependent glycosyltransferase [Streptomyces zingiberis]
MAVAMVTTAVRQTPTIDEPVYVAAAEVYRQEHSLRFNPEHPPLGKLLVAAGTAFAGPRLEPGSLTDQTRLGRRLLYESGNDPWRLMLAARLPVIAFTLLLGLVVLAFARDLTGDAGGLAALTLYAFSPDVIAHGSLATLDVPAAGFLLTSVWQVWQVWLARLAGPGIRPFLRLGLVGGALGAAVAVKMSMLAAVPVLLALTAVSVWHATGPRRTTGPGQTTGPGRATDGRGRPAAGAHERPGAAPSRPPARSRLRAPSRRSGRAALVLLSVLGVAAVSVAVVWAAYLAVDPRLRWSAPQNLPAVGGLRGHVIDLLPFPEPFRDGMRIQFGFEARTWEGFLFGRLYSGSLWYYLPAALLVKTPLGALALWAAGVLALLTSPRLRPAAPYVLAPAAVLLAAAMTGERDLGVRYAVFLPMLLAVAAAGAVARRPRGRRGRRVHAVTASLLLLSVAVSSLRTFPYYLPYANEAFGGPAATHRHLHDSNVDWGQDLGRLAGHLREHHPGERIWLVYKGSGVPAHYGIRAADPREVPPGEVRGVLAVSNSSVAKAKGRLRVLLERSTPVERIGHSITLFRVDAAEGPR